MKTQKLKNVLKPNWQAKCFVIREKNTFMKRAQEEWKHDIVYDPKRSQGHNSLVPFFMTPKVTVTFVVGLTYFMTPKAVQEITKNCNITKNYNITGISWRKITENCNIKWIGGSSWKETVRGKMNGISRCIIVSGTPKNYSPHQKNFWFENILQNIFISFQIYWHLLNKRPI